MARNKYPERTVKKILAAASELFMQKGYDHTSLDDIATKCGVTKGAIYHHFASKEDLLVVMMETYEQNIDWFFTIKNDDKLNGLEKLRAIFYHELKDQDKIKVDAMFQRGLRDPKILAKQLELSIHTVAPMIQDIIQEGIDDGSIETKQPKQVAEILVILINIWINPGILPTSRKETLAKVQFLNDLLTKMGIALFDDRITKTVESYLNILKKESE